MGRFALVTALFTSACAAREPEPRTPEPAVDPAPTPAPAPAAQAAPNPTPCIRRDGAEGDVEKGVKTAGAAAELGGRVAVEGVKTFGRAIGGWFGGGSDQAGQKWKEGANQTRSVARGEAGRVDTTASAPPCEEAPPAGAVAAPPAP